MNRSFKEDEIRPDKLMKKQAEYFAYDVKRLLKSKNNFVSVNCPACGKNKKRRVFEKCGIVYLVCLYCQTMYASPRPTLDMLDKYYTKSRNYAYWNKHIFPASESARRQNIFIPRAKLVADMCNKHMPSADSLLEVGAGFGTFCEEIAKFKIFNRIVAVESTPYLASTCRKRGIYVFEGQFEQLDFKNQSFDAITCFETIEHIFSPIDFVRKIRNLINNNGLVFVTCPNAKGFEISMLQHASNSVDVEHLNYFTPESLSHLFSSCGFDIVEICTPGKLDAELVRKKALNKEIDLSSHAFLSQILIDKWEDLGSDFQQFLARHNLSSHMWVVARKR